MCILWRRILQLPPVGETGRGAALLIDLQPTTLQRTHGICMRSDGQLIMSTLFHQQSVHLLSVRTSFHVTPQDWQQCRDSQCAPGAGSCWNRWRGSSSTPASASTPACTTSGTALETVRVRFPGPGSSQDAFNPFCPCSIGPLRSFLHPRIQRQ